MTVAMLILYLEDNVGGNCGRIGLTGISSLTSCDQQFLNDAYWLARDRLYIFIER